MDGFTILTNLSDKAELVITQLATQPVNVLCTGVMFIAAPTMMIWLLYRAYMIMGGFVSDPLPAFLKDAAIKMSILFVAGTSSYFLSDVQNVMKETPIAMAKDLSGENKALTIVENKMIVAFDGLDKLNTNTAAPQNDPSTSRAKKIGNALFKWVKIIVPAVNVASTAVNAFTGIWSVVVIFIKLMIITAGLMYIAIALTKVLLITKIGFMLGLGFGPLFLMFAAFDKTRGWFQSWLNYTLGLGMSYVVIMFSAKILLTILDLLWQDGVSWANVFGSFFVCVALAVIIARVGDIASAWFGSGNIADGTAAAVAIAMGRSFGMAKGGAQTFGSNAKNLRDLPNDLRNRANTKYAYNRNKSAQNRAKQIAAIRKQKSHISIGKGK